MQYNVNNPAVKRILREVKEMEAEPSDQYHANPLEVCHVAYSCSRDVTCVCVLFINNTQAVQYDDACSSNF